MSYDEAYKEIPDYFGAEPSPLLVDYHHLIDKTRPVLDIGAGQGRNSLFLARQGFSVDAIDPSQVGVDRISGMAADENLPIRVRCSGFESFKSENAPYGAVLIFGIIQVLPRESIKILADKVRLWISPGGLVMISAFTTEDPGFAKIAATSEKLGENSFRIDSDNIRTFLRPGEILTLFGDYKSVHHWEGIGPVHRHGGKEPHRHAVVHAVFRR
jgi:2-polyprenyl-3-methyl-5-hydroxy-6-metoxy-1,4-benzoquinol methylase